MFRGSINEIEYVKQMEGLSVLCREIREMHKSYEYIQGRRIKKLRSYMKSGLRGLGHGIVTKCKDSYGWKQIRRNACPIIRPRREKELPNYFSDERIAVYTCIFGRYDIIQKPICYPDNIDYYIITDLEMNENCGWKKFDISKFESQLEGMSNIEKNRWFKMHPHEVFSDYRYSVYVDGNVVPVTDFTEFVNRIGSCGIAMYWHSPNNCIYQEALQNRYIVRKISPKEVDQQVEYLKSNGMPENYGMTTCNVIARDHTNQICMKLMDDWWTEFMAHCKRDQLSFPYVAWKNNINMADIAVLGDDVWNTDALLVVQHTD